MENATKRLERLLEEEKVRRTFLQFPDGSLACVRDNREAAVLSAAYDRR